MTPLEPDVVERVALKPCPFCGGEPTEPVRQPEGHWKIFCHGCGIHKQGPKEVYAVAAWNTRASISAQSPQLEELREALAKCERALRPFADCVFNDNGDMTISPSILTVGEHGENLIDAYFAHRSVLASLNSGIGGGS